MPSQEFLLMSKLVSQIYSRSDAEPFREPVEWKELGLFDYPEIIKKPMDLGQVKRNLEADAYDTIHGAANDVRLVWKNCMQYNADGSDFYNLALSLSKKFEEKFTKLLKEVNLPVPEKQEEPPTLEEKRSFAKSLYKISKEELGRVVTDLDNKCPESLSKNQAEDEVQINVDAITPSVFHEVVAYTNSCTKGNAAAAATSGSGGSATTSGSSRKKKAASNKGSSKKSKSS